MNEKPKKESQVRPHSRNVRHSSKLKMCESYKHPGPSVVELVSACQGLMREKGESRMYYRGKTGLSAKKTQRKTMDFRYRNED